MENLNGIVGGILESKPFADADYFIQKQLGRVVSIGRNPQQTNSIIVPFPDGRISRHHMDLYVDSAGTLKLRDLSTNGTELNDIEIPKGNSTAIYNGDYISLGSQNFKVTVDTDTHLVSLNIGESTYDTRLKVNIETGKKVYERPPRTEAGLLRLKIHRKLISGLTRHEVAAWAKQNGIPNPDPLISQAADIEVIKNDLIGCKFGSKRKMQDGSILEIAQKKYLIGGREYLPIIINNKMELAYLSSSRKVFVRLKAVTPADGTPFWHVKKILENAHDVPMQIDYELKKISVDLPTELIRNDEDEKYFFEGFGVYRENQKEAVTEVAQEYESLRDRKKIAQLTETLQFDRPPLGFVVDRVRHVVEIIYEASVSTDQGEIDARFRVILSRNPNRPKEVQISVTPSSSKYMITGVPQEKVHRGPPMRLSSDAEKAFSGVDLSQAYRSMREGTDIFEAVYRTQAEYIAAERFILQNQPLRVQQNTKCLYLT
jgi:hypothetical protein